MVFERFSWGCFEEFCCVGVMKMPRESSSKVDAKCTDLLVYRENYGRCFSLENDAKPLHNNTTKNIRVGKKISDF